MGIFLPSVEPRVLFRLASSDNFVRGSKQMSSWLSHNIPQIQMVAKETLSKDCPCYCRNCSFFLAYIDSNKRKYVLLRWDIPAQNNPFVVPLWHWCFIVQTHDSSKPACEDSNCTLLLSVYTTGLALVENIEESATTLLSVLIITFGTLSYSPGMTLPKRAARLD